jgi:hypothetical protein
MTYKEKQSNMLSKIKEDGQKQIPFADLLDQFFALTVLKHYSTQNLKDFSFYSRLIDGRTHYVF